jgi:uncharacterized protein
MSGAILVFSATAGYRHDSIPAGIEALRAIGAELGLTVDATEDPGVFTGAGLRTYQAVVFLQATGPLLDAAQRTAVAEFVGGGGGFLGVHAGIIAEPEWPFFRQLFGTEFTDHPEIQSAVVRPVLDHPATAGLPARWERTDEWYNFAAHPGMTVLLTVDEDSYSGGTMGAGHPIAWCHDRYGGRMLYTSLGHTIESYAEPAFLAHLAGGLRWVLGSAV